MKVILSLIILAAITVLPNCIGYNPKPTNLTDLPALTTSGKNTFGCYLNGEVKYNEYEYQIQAYEDRGMLTISGDLPFMNMIFTMPIIERGPKHFVIDSTDNLSDGSINFYNQNYCSYEFGMNDTNGNKASFHFRRYDQQVLSGTFMITAIDSCGSYEITQGRFDVSLGYHNEQVNL